MNTVLFHIKALEDASCNQVAAPIGTIHALRQAEIGLIGVLWERKQSLSSMSDLHSVDNYYHELHEAVRSVETTHAESAKSLIDFAAVAFRIALATISGGTGGIVLGSVIPGEKWITEAIKGATPGLIAQSGIEISQAVQKKRELNRQLDPEIKGRPATPFRPNAIGLPPRGWTRERRDSEAEQIVVQVPRLDMPRPRGNEIDGR